MLRRFLSIPTIRPLVKPRAFSTTRHVYQQSGKSKFTVSPYNDAINKLKANAKMVGKISVYTTLSVTCAVAVIWQMTHVYIEHMFEATPPELGYQARNLLHGAYIREHIAPDHELAAVYLREALRIAIEEKHLAETSETVIELRLRLANDEAHAGNLLDAITEYTRAWKMMNADPRGPDIAKKIGDLYIKIQEFEQAEEFLAWALYKLDNGVLKVKTSLSLASLYAMQRNYKLCLPLLTSALQNVPEDEVCLKAILQNQLSEVMYGLGKVDECMGWAQAALASCSKGRDQQDCFECGGVASNNLGSILEVKE
jgi:tetratricopeptide (TPR) repeat protein